MQRFLWKMTAAGSLLGGLFAIAGAVFAKSAPQEAAAAAVGVAAAVIPYCLARAYSEMKMPAKREG